MLRMRCRSISTAAFQPIPQLWCIWRPFQLNYRCDSVEKLSSLPEGHDSVTNLSWFATLHGTSHADFNWTRLRRFGILDLEHAERSYVNCVLNRFVLVDFGHLADWWLSPLLLKAFGRSVGLGIVCRIMTNDLFGTKKHGYLLLLMKGGPTKRQLT